MAYIFWAKSYISQHFSDQEIEFQRELILLFLQPPVPLVFFFFRLHIPFAPLLSLYLIVSMIMDLWLCYHFVITNSEKNLSMLIRLSGVYKRVNHYFPVLNHTPPVWILSKLDLRQENLLHSIAVDTSYITLLPVGRI